MSQTPYSTQFHKWALERTESVSYEVLTLRSWFTRNDAKRRHRRLAEAFVDSLRFRSVEPSQIVRSEAIFNFFSVEIEPNEVIRPINFTHPLW